MLASTSSSGEKGNTDTFDSVLSANGDQLVFDAYATNLHPEANGYLQVYVKDLITGDLVLASAASDGQIANSYSSTLGCRPTGRRSSSPLTHGISTPAARTRGPMFS